MTPIHSLDETAPRANDNGRGVIWTGAPGQAS